MLNSARALEILNNIDLFSALQKQELIALADIAKTEEHKAGRVVFRHGDVSDSFRVVLGGLYEAYLWDDFLKIERPLSSFGKGEVFGEMGVLTGEPRSAFVRARQDGETLYFPKDTFFPLLERQPKLLFNLAKMLAHRVSAANKSRGLPLQHLAAYKITADIVKLLPLQVILRHRVLPVSQVKSEITVGIVDPSDQVARNTVTEFLPRGTSINWVCVSQPDFELFRDKKLFDLVHESSKETATDSTEISYLINKNVPGVEVNTPNTKILDDLIRTAIDAGASDLHFEPGPDGVAARARIDGRLIELGAPLNYNIYKPIVSRIKVLSEMDITETRLPQDSVLRIKYGQRNIDLRISTVATPRAESVVCRLFDPQQRKLDLNNMIVAEPIAELVKKLFCLPSGLVLITGPTGSGKTSTLYAGLQARQQHSPTNKVVTAEDPIEYELNGTTQIQENPTIGLTFERILRSALRQDPDIILVGEIRDKPSMEIAMEAALTGHLVLSSLHTNSVFETIMRMRQRGVESYVIASTLRGVVTQRLVPRLCSACSEETRADAETLAELRAREIVGPDETPKLWKGRGCTHCRMTGVKGRVGLYEVLVVGSELRDAIENGGTLLDMEQSVKPENYVSMRRYARYLLEKGLVAATDLYDVLPSGNLATKFD